MQLSVVKSRAQTGIDSVNVNVEIHLANGLPSFNIVGLPEAAVKESKDRVRSSITNCQFNFPLKRIIVNLAPADLPKDGGRFDLPIAIGLLAASGQINNDQVALYEFAGELALSGELRPFKGSLSFAISAHKNQHAIIIPAQNAHEASLVGDVPIYAANNLLAVCNHLNGIEKISPWKQVNNNQVVPPQLDIQDIYGQSHAKRALEIAASGNHSLLMQGPPGSGKTMLASRLPGISPPLEISEALEIAAIYSISHFGFDPDKWRQRPFRSPHHTSSAIALVGGGSNPQPGEITLAHNGVLFLDELPEFSRKVLEVLREPLEAGEITISRAKMQVLYPAKFQLIAAMNPCPCGYLGSSTHDCSCGPTQINRYCSKISGPLLDRIDIHLEVPPIPTQTLLTSTQQGREDSATIQQRVITARQIQLNRQGTVNNQLMGKNLEKNCWLSTTLKQYILKTIEELHFSARSYHRILKVARSIADLEQSNHIEEEHMIEALSFRKFDRRTI